MKNQENENARTNNRKSFNEWKKRRDVILKAIPLEVDLENRQIFFRKGLPEDLSVALNSSNVDRLINEFVAPEDSENVTKSLLQAQKGLEKPITFNFVHPGTSQKLKFEYRYEIEYVKYSSTRLNGVLVNIRDKKNSAKNKRKI